MAVSTGRSVHDRTFSKLDRARNWLPVSTRTSESSVANPLTLPNAGMKAMLGDTSSRSPLTTTG
jgi:hypothetical protein